ncbi:hypothetical protein OsI_16904 [Oryza sativa Indica Group]|uniref:Uncharacterized protein n=1 Tax=Oryza sativa subsp. indica TaxID=39946 RepID=A2XW80_ORYSI|nr:hypothetical protein OsI_16904 [Oryza sativa Indica Group]
MEMQTMAMRRRSGKTVATTGYGDPLILCWSPPFRAPGSRFCHSDTLHRRMQARPSQATASTRPLWWELSVAWGAMHQREGGRWQRREETEKRIEGGTDNATLRLLTEHTVVFRRADEPADLLPSVAGLRVTGTNS